MLRVCDRCKREVECERYGNRPEDYTWLCEGCIWPEVFDVDEACSALEKALGKDGSDTGES